MSAGLERPLLVFDGDCGFCRWWIARWQPSTAGHVDYAPYQEAAARFPAIPIESFRRAVQLIEPDGTVTEAAEAVFRALAAVPRHRWMLWAYLHLRGARAACERAYVLVARHRAAFSRLTRWLWGPDPAPPTWFLTRWLLLRGLALVYLIAFLSLRVQVDALIGENGILPAGSFLAAVRDQLGPSAWQRLPTLCWLRPDGDFPRLLCDAGIGLSLVYLLLGVAPCLVLPLLWVLYLSLVNVGEDFLSFQWDTLLLETGFATLLLSPAGLRPGIGWRAPPSRAGLWLLRWLLFRLMFSSGASKLASGDPSWRHLTALQVHYETQPLPTWIGWYAHQFPPGFQRFSVAAMFFIELVVPFLIFLPRRPRLAGFALLVVFQVLISLTGNYTFFGLLTILLCVTLVDDGVLKRLFPARLREPLPASPSRSPTRTLVLWLRGAVAAVLLLLSAAAFTETVPGLPSPPRSVDPLLRSAMSFHVTGRYGLFAVMTTRRPEIVVEGSRDGQTWLAYRFRWKPGDPHRRPTFVAPHQPRLDWQMWFAALSSYRNEPWFTNFLVRLLQGSREVTALLAENPFPDSPPRFVRAVVYDYRFTDIVTRRQTGAWWRREMRGPYSPVLSLKAQP